MVAIKQMNKYVVNKGMVKVITYIGNQTEFKTAPRRRIYEFEPYKSIPIGFKKLEVHPKDAEQLARKINSKGHFLFVIE